MDEAFSRGSTTMEMLQHVHHDSLDCAQEPHSSDLKPLAVRLLQSSIFLAFFCASFTSTSADIRDQNNIRISYLNKARRTSKSLASFYFRQIISLQRIMSKGKSVNAQMINDILEIADILEAKSLNVVFLRLFANKISLIEDFKQNIRNRAINVVGEERSNCRNQNTSIKATSNTYAFSRRAWARLGTIEHLFFSHLYGRDIYGLTQISNPIYTQEHRVMRYFCVWIT